MIQLKAIEFEKWKASDEPLAVFAFEDAGVAGAALLPAAVKKTILEKAKAELFKGKHGECLRLLIPIEGKERRLILVGLGKKKELKDECLRKIGGTISKFAKKRYKQIAVCPYGDSRPFAEGALLASYRFQEYRKPEEDAILSEIWLLADQKTQKQKIESAVQQASVYSEAVCFTRDLVNRGPSDKAPETMGKIAKELSGSGVTVKIIDKGEAHDLGMGSFLSVARGSSVPPCFVHLSYKPAGAKKKIGVVGKGITFDSGGLSIKPAQSMEEMKMDMAGAACALSVFKALPRLKPKVEVHGFCAFSYNMPGPDATKPGDIVKAMNGKTIEVLNTDAEGRLVLADALVYAERLKLDAIIDLATLTGAALVALGSSVTAAMATDKKLLQRLFRASEKTGEKLWELPLVPEYSDHIKSSVADLRNISKVRGEAGTIIGGLFLKEFVASTPWVHLDIAGPAWANGELDYCPSGGTGAMVRTLLEYIENL